MKSIVAFLFALLVGTACVYKSGYFSKSSAPAVATNVVVEESKAKPLLEKRAVFHTLKEEDDDDQVFRFEGESKDSDRQRKKVYFQQSALQRKFNGNEEESEQRRRLSSKKSKSKSSKKSKSKSSPYYWFAPVGAPPVKPVSQPVAKPITVPYSVPIAASSPRISQPVGVSINKNTPDYSGKSSKKSSSWKYRYYNPAFVSNAPVAGPGGNGYIYVQATAEDCQVISNGGLVEGQRYMSDSSFTFGFNLVLDNGSTNIETVIMTAKAALQALVAQRIVNCNGYRRRLHQKRAKRHHRKHRRRMERKLNADLDENIIGNAHFDISSCVESTPCDAVAGTCYTCQSTVGVALKGPADEMAVEEEINAILQNTDVIAESDLGTIASTFSATTVTHQETILPQIGGDPHIVTWKGEHYEYHGQCDLVMVADKEFASGLGLDIHIRTKLVRFWSYIKNVSIRIGSDILEIVGNPDVKSRDPMYWINYEYLGDLEEIGGFPVTYTATSGSKSIYEVDLSSKFGKEAKIIIKIYKEFLRVKMIGGEAVWGNTVGLLGDYNTGATLGRDGVSLFEDYYKFGAEWQVNPSYGDAKLFQKLEAPQFPEACQLPDNPQGDRRRRLKEGSVTSVEAEEACASLKDPAQIQDCVYDILATQDLDMVGAF